MKKIEEEIKSKFTLDRCMCFTASVSLIGVFGYIVYYLVPGQE